MKRFLWLHFFFILNCNNLYFIDGIKGNEVLSELERHRDSIFVYTTFFGFGFTGTSSRDQIRNETICNSNGIQTFELLATATTGSNFSIPTDIDSRVDLIPSNGVSYFRSSPLLNDSFVRFSNSNTTAIDLYAGPILFKNLLGVEENKYYTLKSF